jgi:hypothetical protein
MATVVMVTVTVAAAVANMQRFSTSLTATQHCIRVPKTWYLATSLPFFVTVNSIGTRSAYAQSVNANIKHAPYSRVCQGAKTKMCSAYQSLENSFVQAAWQ